jgi:hypothetical protein
MALQRTLSGFKSINDVFVSGKEFEKIRETVKNYSVVEGFQIIFPELSKIAQAIRLEKKTLFLRVENSVWKSELNFQKALLIEKINKHFNEQVIKTVKFI